MYKRCRTSRKRSAMVVSESPLFDPYFRGMLGAAGFDRVVVSRTGKQKTLQRVRPETVVVMADGGGERPLEAIRRTRAAAPESRIVVVSRNREPLWNALARACGADRLLGAEADGRDLLAALQASA